MTRREKFGTLVLLGERQAGPLGSEHLAARLGPTGLDRLVSVMRYAPAVSGHADAVRLLADEARRAAQLHDAGLLRLLGVGRVGTSFYVSYEHLEGRNLAAIIERCRSERFPLAPDNALLVASRAAATLDFLQGRRDDSGRALSHGLLVPRNVLVTYSGEVKLTGIGLWPALRETGLLGDDDRAYLAPEQKGGEPGDSRSDVYALGLLGFEMLTLERPEGADPATSVGRATMLGASGEREPMPPAVSQILETALASDPESRYPGPAEMRAAIDSLLFSGELSSTTFNLAFFMHTLFRQDIDEEARMLEEARAADYTEYLASASGTPEPEAPPTVPEGASPGPASPAAEPVATRPAATEPGPTLPADQAPTVDVAPAPVADVASAPGDPATQPLPAEPGSGRYRVPDPGESSGRLRAPRADRPPDASRSGRGPRARRGRGAAAPTRGRGLLLLGALAAALAVGGVVGYARFLAQPAAEVGPPTTTLSPEAQAALARVKELEARIAELEAEQVAADAGEASPEPAGATAPLASATAPADPAARSGSAPSRSAPSGPGEEELRARERARAEARRQAEAERQRREEELRLLAEQKQEAEARLVLEQGRAAASANGSAALPTVAPPPPTPAPTLAPPPERGSLADLSDPEVTPPVLVHDARVDYPPAAERAQKEASVVLDVLVDENGRVASARVIEPAAHRLGFDDAALRMVRNRRYRPATKRGVPVKVHMTVRVAFTLAP